MASRVYHSGESCETFPDSTGTGTGIQYRTVLFRCFGGYILEVRTSNSSTGYLSNYTHPPNKKHRENDLFFAERPCGARTTHVGVESRVMWVKMTVDSRRNSSQAPETVPVCRQPSPLSW